jgi:hypothetical protein
MTPFYGFDAEGGAKWCEGRRARSSLLALWFRLFPAFQANFIGLHQ